MTKYKIHELILEGASFFNFSSFQSPLFLIKKGGDPRWLISKNCWAAKKVLGQWKPYSFSSRISWKIFVFLLGFVRWVPLYFGGKKDNSYVCYVGTKGKTQKLVVFIFDGKSIESVLKIPIGSRAADHIFKEADNIRYANLRGLTNIEVVEHNGFSLQSFCHGYPSSTNFEYMHLKFLLSLVEIDRNFTLNDISEKLSLFSSHSALLENVGKQRLKGYIEKLSAISENFPVVFEHGDFAPWNIKKTENGKISLVDWEFSKKRSFPLFDLLYFFSAISIYVDFEKEFPWKKASSHIKKYSSALNLDEKGVFFLIALFNLEKLQSYSYPNNEIEIEFYRNNLVYIFENESYVVSLCV